MNKALLVYCLKVCLFISFICFLSDKIFCQTITKDSFECKGAVAVTGLVQTGDENRTVFSLLSVLKMGTDKYQAEPLTSIAYSTKPGKQVEAEYLENIIFRYHQNKKIYPAAGVAVEHSLLRKINFRYTLSAAFVYNAVNTEKQTLKLGLGYSHEFTKFDNGAFISPVNDKNEYARQVEQLYARIKGENNIGKLTIMYDVFYQTAFNNLSDRRWFIIGNLDYFIAKHVSIRASAVSSFEAFTATNVSPDNFRLTYGINVQF